MFVPAKKSKIIVKETKYLQRGTTIQIILPIAELPKQEKEKKLDTLEGTISSVPMDTANPESKKMTVIIDKNNEVTVITNHPYVVTLTKLYMNRKVLLKGYWKKDVVIYGRRYKNFWVEDHELLKQ
ncbi:MAG: hypothetical protein QXF61_09170 [Nitrososphaeria archaeon]